MEKQRHTLKKKQRVRLKDGFDSFYDWARVGAQGIVKDVKFDSAGYPFALIEWDEDDWRYEGESDGWHFQSHFEPVEEHMSDEITPELLAQIVKAVQAAQSANAEEEPDPTPPEEQEDESKDENYSKAITYALAELEGTESFMVIAVQKIEQEDGPPILAPSVVSYSRSSEGICAIEAQLGSLAAVSHQGLIEEKMARLDRDES